jgi:CubicO group peptidase (beta-lactamase class C family)
LHACVYRRRRAASDPDLQSLLSRHGVPGLALAVVGNGAPVEVATAGVRNAVIGTPVDADTVFEAASLSKPVFAYAVLQLIDSGVLSLDTRLSAAITVRHVLTHTSGLPNWRAKTTPLKTYFAPGERFSYSGEGFVWLQQVVETITGEPTDRLTERLVFEPLEMRRSSYIWQPAFDGAHADPHNAGSSPQSKKKPTEANVAYSFQTTAPDYARFLGAVLSGARLKRETARL